VKLSNVYPHALAIATAAVGQIVAYVPSWRPEAQAIISAGAVVIAFGMLVYEAVARKGTVVAGAGQVEAAAAKAVRRELHGLVGALGAMSGTAQAGATAPVSDPQPVSAPPAAAPAPTTPAA